MFIFIFLYRDLTFWSLGHIASDGSAAKGKLDGKVFDSRSVAEVMQCSAKSIMSPDAGLIDDLT